MGIYKIDHVARLVGLSKHVIRSWERRFHFLTPKRGDNRYRMYSAEDADLLIYIKGKLDEGFSIGEIAKQGRKTLIEDMQNKKARTSELKETPLERINRTLLSSINPLDKDKFIAALNECVSLIPFDEVFYKILTPLQQKLGDMWHQGEIGVGVEHFVSNQIRQKFLSFLNQLPVSHNGPKVVIACLPEDNHELGAWMASYMCTLNGCQVYYLGARMPVEELGAFCVLTMPHLVLLSCTGSFNEQEARALADDYKKCVLPVCPVWAGGTAVGNLKPSFLKQGIDVLEDLEALQQRLKRLSHHLWPENK